jgi:NFACT protein C-terminal domain
MCYHVYILSSACMQALPYNQGLDAQAVRGTIELAKQRIAPVATLTPAQPSEPSEFRAATASNKKYSSQALPSASTPQAATQGVPDVEIDDEDDEEGTVAATARMASELAEISALTAQPLDEDELLYAVPMCAPYDALAKCKYRVKLVPGPQKKGKAAKQALELLTALPNCTARCASLLFCFESFSFSFITQHATSMCADAITFLCR